MNADESVSSVRRLIHLDGDGHDALDRIDFFGVYRRSSAAQLPFFGLILNRFLTTDSPTCRLILNLPGASSQLPAPRKA
jgi:hypothetical protein